MDRWVAVIGLLAVLFLIGRSMPGRSWLAVIAITLALIVAVVFLERADQWPDAWRR